MCELNSGVKVLNININNFFKSDSCEIGIFLARPNSQILAPWFEKVPEVTLVPNQSR